jgi:hypothetical protein
MAVAYNVNRMRREFLDKLRYPDYEPTNHITGRAEAEHATSRIPGLERRRRGKSEVRIKK